MVVDMKSFEEELDPSILSEILAKNATELTDEEIDQLIRAFRIEREAVLAAQAAGAKAPRSKIKTAGKTLDGAGLTLESLGLENIDAELKP
jgi:predicted TIM-barrel enzyme